MSKPEPDQARPASRTGSSLPPDRRAAAYFDVDGTLLAGDIVRYYVHLRTRGMSRHRRLLWLAAYAPEVVRILVLDRIDRGRMNEVFYRGYAGMDLEAVRRLVREDYRQLLGDHVYPAARGRIAEHRRAGHLVVLVTGSLDFLIEPVARDLEADEVIAMPMEVKEGKLTGRLLRAPLAGPEKARVVREHAAKHDVDLGRSFAYGDALADLPMLEAVGHAVAVNPDRRLATHARARGYARELWKR